MSYTYRTYRPWLVMAVLATLAGWTSHRAAAKEPVQDFLDGLRQREYFDIADQYLESLRNNSDIPEETRQIIPYEQGRTLVDSSRAIRDMPLRLKELDRAMAKFQEFIKASPSHPLAAGANTQLGNVLVERGRAALEQANKPSKVAEKETLLTQARSMFDQARAVFDAAEKKFEADVDSYPKFIDPKEEKRIEARAQALADLIQARLYSATLLYEYAQTYEAGTPDSKKQLQASADKYKELFEKYRKRLAGLYAGMWYARCMQEMGDTKRALGVYEELLAQPDQPEEFRTLKAKSLRLAMECWTHPKEKLNEEAVKRGEEWLKAARVTEDRSPEGLGIRYYTALALHNQVEAAKDEKATEAMKKKVRDLQAHSLFVARSPGDYQQQAKDLLSKYRDLGDKGPQNFTEAKEAAKVALDNMQTAISKIKLAPVSKEEAKIPEYEQERVTSRNDAIKYYQLALKLKDSESSLDDINVIRYFLTYLNYDAGNLYDAAILGEFLARKYPKSSGARPGANIAMASYLQSYNAAREDNRQFETQRMVDIANYITATWPGEAEADQAWMLLGDVAIREKDLVKAAEYLSRIPETSPRRGEANLKSGQALWGTYLSESRKPETDTTRPPQDKLDALAQQAQTTLEQGVEQMRKSVTDAASVTYTLVASELSLSQIYIGSGQAEKAIALLETPMTGALALVAAKSEVVEKGNFPEETYKAALRAYVGAQNMDAAEKMMSALDARVAAKGGDQATLTKIYISLGRELEEQVQTLKSDPKRADDLQKVLKGFETFLSRISTREQGNTFASLNWVGETFFRLGSGLDSGSGTASQQAKDYYASAAKTYQAMIDRSKKEAAFAPNPDAILALDVRLSMCERRQGKHKEALDRLQAILTKNPNVLEAQKQAAYTYQEWAEASKDVGYYLNAMQGGRRAVAGGPYIIWGWYTLANKVQSNPRLADSFHEARFNLAECQFKHAMGKSGTEKADKLKAAEQAIAIVYRLRPTMGGEEMKAKYDRLLKSIQTAAGQKPGGVAALEAAAKAAAAAAPTKTTASAAPSGGK